jgi:serine/threonine-protein kinase
LQNPTLLALSLPPQILERATDGLCWISLICAVTCVVLTVAQHLLQPEFAQAWRHPILRAASIGATLLSIGFMAIQRSGWLSKQALLDLGMVFQVVIVFLAGIFECAAYQDPNAVVLGVSCAGVWMMMCGRLMPNAPLKSACAAALCVVAWPLGYWVDVRAFGYAAMPWTRLLVWMLPLAIVAIWMYFLNNRTLAFYVQQQRAEDIGSYTLVNPIGKGGMGEVWRARHKTLARDAAVKLIRPEILNGSSGRIEQLLRRRFEREAQVTASLRSPHTVALYDFGKSKDGAFYYVMELLDGIDLQTLVDRFGPIPPARVVHILLQVCQSLEEAHSAGLVHRDIKPRNILIGKLGLEYDFAKVLDFGLVKALNAGDPDRTLTTMDDITTGTPAYLSPEVAMGQRYIDGRADLYSLGCTAYFLLTGQMVFDGPSATALAIAHVQTPPRPMSERCDLPIPTGLEAIVMRLIEKDPDRRIQSARELARRLRMLADIEAWPPERAEEWWDTNLPDLAMPDPAPEEITTELLAETAA